MPFTIFGGRIFMKRITSFILVVVVAIFFGCTASQPSQEKQSFYQLTILHTNDHHGHFWKNRYGEYGLAAQKTLVDGIRNEVYANGGEVLVLSAGDVNTGVPESDLQDAEPDFKAMNEIGYDAMTLGNHEFDNPPEVLAKQKIWAEFPFLGANVINKKTGKPLYDAYRIFELNGLNVAVFGLIAGDTPKLVDPKNLESIKIKDPIETAMMLVPELNKKADVVIALTHLGFYEGGEYGSSSPGDMSLATAVDNIDVIIGGHSHSTLETSVMQNGTIIVQAGDSGKYVGRLDLKIEGDNVTEVAYRLIPVNLKKKVEKDGETVRVHVEEEIAENPTVLALLTTYQEQGQEELGRVIGSTTGVFEGERNIVRSRETNLGNLIARTQRLKAGADVAVMNSGGIRTSITAGDISYRDVLKVQPFSNTIGVVTLNGSELKQYLEIAANKTPGSGGFAQFDNVEIVMAGEKLVEATVDGKEVMDGGSYKLAVNSFIANGGDDYMKVSDHPTYIDTGFVDADILAEYVQENSPLNPDDYAPTDDVSR